MFLKKFVLVAVASPFLVVSTGYAQSSGTRTPFQGDLSAGVLEKEEYVRGQLRLKEARIELERLSTEIQKKCPDNGETTKSGGSAEVFSPSLERSKRREKLLESYKNRLATIEKEAARPGGKLAIWISLFKERKPKRRIVFLQLKKIEKELSEEYADKAAALLNVKQYFTDSQVDKLSGYDPNQRRTADSKKLSKGEACFNLSESRKEIIHKINSLAPIYAGEQSRAYRGFLEGSASRYVCQPGDEVRLDRNGGPAAKLPVFDQGQFGNCYAYALSASMYTFFPGQGLTSPTDLSIAYQDEAIRRLIEKGNLNYSDVITGGFLCATIRKTVNQPIMTLQGEADSWFSQERGRIKKLVAADEWLRVVLGLSPKQRQFMADRLEKVFDEIKKSDGKTEDYYISLPTSNSDTGQGFYSYINSRLKGDGAFTYETAQALRHDFQQTSFQRYFDLYRQGGKPTVAQAEQAFFPLVEKYRTQYPELMKAFKMALPGEVRRDLAKAADIQESLAVHDRAASKNAEFMREIQTHGLTYRQGAEVLGSVAFYLKKNKDILDVRDLREIMRSPKESVAALRRIVSPKFDEAKKFTVPQQLRCDHQDIGKGAGQNQRMRVLLLSALLAEKPYAPMLTLNSEIFLNRKRYPKGEAHGLVVTGARYAPETKECEYLLHNSQGQDCSDFYDGKKCEDGKIWVSESRLAPASSVVTGLSVD